MPWRRDAAALSRRYGANGTPSLQDRFTQWEVSIALCPQPRRFAVAKADERRDARCKTAGIRRIPVQRPIIVERL